MSKIQITYRHNITFSNNYATSIEIISRYKDVRHAYLEHCEEDSLVPKRITDYSTKLVTTNIPYIKS